MPGLFPPLPAATTPALRGNIPALASGGKARAKLRLSRSAEIAAAVLFQNQSAPRMALLVGGVAEWSIAPVLKTDAGGTLPWVRIPPPPPLALEKAFSRSGCGRIFPLFSGVMRVWLSTGLGATRPESGLPEPIFSGPHDCDDLVNFCKRMKNNRYFCSGLSSSTAVALPDGTQIEHIPKAPARQISLSRLEEHCVTLGVDTNR